MEVRIGELRRPMGCITSLTSLLEDHRRKEARTMHRDRDMRATKTYRTTINALAAVDMIWDAW